MYSMTAAGAMKGASANDSVIRPSTSPGSRPASAMASAATFASMASVVCPPYSGTA
jgi:hypothetical protein